MNAPLQYHLDHVDLALALTLVRDSSLARATELPRVDVPTVFQVVRRLEKNLGKALFDKSRSGYLANQTARHLAQQAELAEQALETARIGLELEREVFSDTVHLTCFDAVLHGLLLPAPTRFMPDYLTLQLELVTPDDFANLSRRSVGITLCMTRTPSERLVRRNLDEVHYVPCVSERYLEGRDAAKPAMLHWIVPDDFLPDHPSVVWHRRHYPGALPACRYDGVLVVAKMAHTGLGLMAVPIYLLHDGDGLQVLDTDLKGCASTLRLLTRPDCRVLRSVVALFGELERHVRLGDE